MADLSAGFRAFWMRVIAPRRALLAVSGGADSMAMMRLAADLAREDVADFEIATVDHGLRPGSREEAETVADAARELGFRHAILSWEGEKPRGGVQAAARAARYRLLADYASKVDAEAVVVAHTAEDQAETVFMRRARGSGPRGLAGMAEKSLIAAGASKPVQLLRPFLRVRRAALRSYLQVTGSSFVKDPSNENLKFERIRVRHRLAHLEAAGVAVVEALLRTADAMRIEADRIEAAENKRFQVLDGRFCAFGTATLAATATAQDRGLIARLVFAVGGGEYPPALQAAKEALASASAGAAATLGGAIIERSGEAIRIRREPAALFGRAGVAPAAPVPLGDRRRSLWDRRFIVENRLGAPAEIRPLDAAAISRHGLAPSAIGAPALFMGPVVAAIPGESDGFEALAAERFYRRVNRFQ